MTPARDLQSMIRDKFLYYCQLSLLHYQLNMHSLLKQFSCSKSRLILEGYPFKIPLLPFRVRVILLRIKGQQRLVPVKHPKEKISTYGFIDFISLIKPAFVSSSCLSPLLVIGHVLLTIPTLGLLKTSSDLCFWHKNLIYYFYTTSRKLIIQTLFGPYV